MVEKNNLIIESLLKCARREELSDRQRFILEKWHSRNGDDRRVEELVHDKEWLLKSLRQLGAAPSSRMRREVESRIAWNGDPLPVLAVNPWRLTQRAAALVLGILLIGLGIWHHRAVNPAEPSENFASVLPRELPLPSEAAQLTLTDGSTVAMDSLKKGETVEDREMEIRKVGRDSMRLAFKRSRWPWNGQEFYDGAEKRVMPPAVVSQCFSAGKDHSYTLFFPDSSFVILQKGAAFRYPFPLRGNQQLAVLNGEAWLNIVPNSDLPFGMMSNNTMIDVLGTFFHVAGNTGDTATELSVYHGEVRVRHGDYTMQLKDSGEVIVRNDGLVSHKIADFSHLLSWTGIAADSPNFHFENTSFDDVIREIADYYKVQIYNPSHINGIPVTGDIAKSLSLEKILARVEQVENGYAYLHKTDTLIVVSADSR